jgi:2-dehydro-3-deoxy-D-gluconate 5-dehydrogenase
MPWNLHGLHDMRHRLSGMHVAWRIVGMTAGEVKARSLLMESTFDLTGKVAIVTGGNGGIGFGIAKGLARAGANIVVAARHASKNAQAIIALQGLGVNALGILTDVQDEAAVQMMVEAALEAFGQVNILVNNAGINIRRTPQDYTLAEWQQVLNTNLTGVFLCSRAVYPYMLKAGGGKIINIGSMTSIFGSSVSAAYAATKGGVVQFTKSLALFWAKDNIQVNAILPGWFHTDLTAFASSARYNLIKARIPHGRWGESDELAGAAVFLASYASDYITGISLPVDGGYTSM